MRIHKHILYMHMHRQPPFVFCLLCVHVRIGTKQQITEEFQT